jgi:IS5 family transposase
VPIEWGQDTKQPNKMAHKDTDARWTQKCGQNHYGYKNHINIDKETKLIASHACTDASVHDSQVLEAVLRDEAVGGKEVLTIRAPAYRKASFRSFASLTPAL